MSAEKEITEMCDEIKEILLEKNRMYGNSALDPVRIFSTASTIEQLNVRLDDKLSRIKNRQSDDSEDPELDIIGYLILKRIKRKSGKNINSFFDTYILPNLQEK